MALIRRSDWPTLSGSLLSDFFDDDNFISSRLGRQSFPAVNVKENEKQYEVELAAPGYQKKDFSISVESGMLTISAQREEDKEEKNEGYTRREFGFASFSRSFNLPENVGEEDINARYEDGILRLTIAKKDQRLQKPRKSIQVK